MEVRRLIARVCAILIPHMSFWSYIKSINDEQNRYEMCPGTERVRRIHIDHNNEFSVCQVFVFLSYVGEFCHNSALHN